jgi:hypothetical protein
MNRSIFILAIIGSLVEFYIKCPVHSFQGNKNYSNQLAEASRPKTNIVKLNENSLFHQTQQPYGTNFYRLTDIQTKIERERNPVQYQPQQPIISYHPYITALRNLEKRLSDGEKVALNSITSERKKAETLRYLYEQYFGRVMPQAITTKDSPISNKENAHPSNIAISFQLIRFGGNQFEELFFSPGQKHKTYSPMDHFLYDHE